MTPHEPDIPAATPARDAEIHVPSLRRVGLAVGFVLAAVLFGAGVYALAWRAELDQAAERGRADLALAADRLTTGLQRYRELAVLLADHPVVVSTALAGSGVQGETARAAAELLQSTADKTGAYALGIYDDKGRALQAMENAAVTPASLERALHGALGADRVIVKGVATPSTETPETAVVDKRRYIFAAPVFTPHGPARGALVVHIDIEALEWSWPTDPSAVFFTDPQGLVFVSNRSELVLRGTDQAPLPLVRRGITGGHMLVEVAAGPYLPRLALHLVQEVPVFGLNAHLLLDLAPVRALAALQAGLATTLFLTFGAFLYVAMARRQTLAVANARLEARVAKRTQALEAANRELIHEIAEREEAEARLKRAQADLVQAGKLTALGEMSAGISHELNQPLMAIRSFAENAQAFLERDNAQKAGENLGRISELARRMGRIIKNLRAFARQESEAVTDVDLGAAVDGALEMMQAKISRTGVETDWTPPARAVRVRGGEVRLQQVVMNLVSNAADAMSDSPVKRITITVQDGDPVRLRVADTGPGIAEPEKMFDPFYTTKEVGAAQGMGLGLSISYGLIQSFGGSIRGMNRAPHEGGGAMFEITLPRAKSTRDDLDEDNADDESRKETQ
ncbi:sensor histidine kinase [Celeribacter sp.]|uniref:sensor histidine kinase n=1 Tax=Celeribacter sp. TaxID=1890673 RepID=UPI003A938309